MNAFFHKTQAVDIRHYMDVSNNVFLVVDVNGIVIEINRYLCELTGLPREKIIGKNWLAEFVADADKEGLLRFFESIIEKKPRGLLNHANRIKSISGEERLIRWSFSLEYDNDDNVLASVGFGLDETNLTELQDQLDDLRELVWKNPNPILRVDFNGSILTANKAAQDLIQIISASVRETKLAWKELVQKFTAGGSESDLQFETDGCYYQFILSVSDDADFITAFGFDVTDILTSKTTFRRLADNVPGALYEYAIHADGHDSIVFLNAQCTEVWGVSEQELAEDPAKLWSLVHKEDFAGLRESITSSASSLAPWQHQWRILTNSGVKWVRGTANPVRQPDGSVSAQILLIDVSQEVQGALALSVARSNIIQVLVRAMEARDPYTAGHQERVARLSVLIAGQMGLDKHAILGLELAAKIHDLGKIQIPAEILTKPTKLHALEFELIKTHAAAGAQLLREIEFEWPIADIVGQHHERWDGSGYPLQLKGQQILLEARIIAIADSVESMTNQRPYRAGMGIDHAISEVRKYSGTLYDPVIAEHALTVITDEASRSLWMAS